MKKLINIIITFLCVILIIIILINIKNFSLRNSDRIPSYFGYQFLIERSDSMAKSIMTNDLIIIRKQDNYKVGDIISYLTSDNSLITHRIVDKKNNCFVTKGDNNIAEDKDLVCNNIKGKVLTNFSQLGGALYFISSITGLLSILLVIIILLMLDLFVNKLILKKSSVKVNNDTDIEVL